MRPRDISDEILNDFKKETGLVDDKRKARRCAYFLDAFDEYRRKLEAVGLKQVKMNRYLLLNAVESYFLDIHRVKEFHGMDLADRYKVAGFTVKWLCKIRPIQVFDEPPVPAANKNDISHQRVLLLNADFALINALIFSHVDRNKITKPNIYQDWLYTAHYRYIDGGVMGQMLEAAATAWPRD